MIGETAVERDLEVLGTAWPFYDHQHGDRHPVCRIMASSPEVNCTHLPHNDRHEQWQIDDNRRISYSLSLTAPVKECCYPPKGAEAVTAIMDVTGC